MQPNQPKRTRRYCFTLWTHNQDIVNEANIQQIFNGILERHRESVGFIIGQLELCPGTNRRHFQCYIEFKRPQLGTRISTLLAVPSNSVHFEVSRGTSSENIDYCSKEESRVSGPWRVGDPQPGQGSRSDLESACNSLRDGGIKRVAEDHPSVYVKYAKGFQQLEQALRPSNHSFEPKEIIIRWGESGLGKTKFAYETYSNSEGGFYRAPAPTKGSVWFDGYNGESTVLFDDYGGASLYPLSMFLQLLDGYAMLVPVKGGFVPWKPRRIVITSNINPDMWYQGENPQQAYALRRRYTDVVEMTKPVPALIDSADITEETN